MEPTIVLGDGKVFVKFTMPSDAEAGLDGTSVGKDQLKGFFTRDGKAHPIFASPGGVRAPAPSAAGWRSGLTSRQENAVKEWVYGGHHSIKNVSRGAGKVSSDRDLEGWKELTNAFGEAIHSAPQPTGPIYRGMTDLTDAEFDRFTNAKTLKTRAPSSFSKQDLRQYIDSTQNGANSVQLIAHTHNGADISSIADTEYGFHEQEAVVPKDSVYQVERVETSPTPDGGRVARIHVSLAAGKPTTKGAPLAFSGKPSRRPGLWIAFR